MTVRKRKTHAKKRTGSKFKTATHRKIMQKFTQAKRAEKVALKKLGYLTRQNKMMVEKMRKTIKAKIAEKTRQVAKFRKQLAKKHAAAVRKLRREHAMAIIKLRKMVSANGNVTPFKRKTKSRKASYRRKSQQAKKGMHATKASPRRKAHARKATSFKRRRSSHARLRRAA